MLKAKFDQIRDAIESNPLAWLGLVAFLFAEYNLYQRGSELTTVCEMVSSLVDLDTATTKPKSAADEAIKICHDRFSPEDIDYSD